MTELWPDLLNAGPFVWWEVSENPMRKQEGTDGYEDNRCQAPGLFSGPLGDSRTARKTQCPPMKRRVNVGPLNLTRVA